MTKRELEKFICERQRNYNSLLRKFGYQPKMSRYLKKLIKEQRIVSWTEIKAKGGSQMIFSRMKDKVKSLTTKELKTLGYKQVGPTIDLTAKEKYFTLPNRR